jgi:HK97 family phage major capsid protein/HK97 family phage prohead protease
MSNVIPLRAYSLLTIKSISEDERVITGIATTPTPDRVGDIVEPKGAEFKLPLPLLWQHDKFQPIGHVIAAKVTDAGIEITARFVKIVEPGRLKDRLDEAWQSVKAGLVGGLSIGFLEREAKRIEGSYGIRFLKWLWFELSVVTVPANAEASITQIKSLDQQQRAASGANRVVHLSAPPGVSGNRKPETSKGTQVKTIAEQLSDWDTKRKAASDRMDAIMQAAEGRTLDESESEEYDNLSAELKGIDTHVARLKEHEKSMVAKATTVTTGGAREHSSVDVRGGVISVRRNVEKATAFTRYCLAMAMAKGNVMHAERIAEERWKDTPEVAMVLKAAVSAGTTQATTWAAPLVQYTDMASEFIELLRPMTIIGKLNAVRRVPFNIRIPRQTAGVSGSFVGEGQPKPVNALAFDNITLTWAKAAVIVVLTDELVRFSNPSAEALVRADMLQGISTYLDRRFIDPSFAGVANVSPASITNGITPRQATGVTVAAITNDVKAVLTAYANANLNLATGVWVMAPKTALALSLIRNVDDEFVFPTISVAGGTWFGLPVITSNAVGLAGSPSDSFIALIDQSEVLLADDGDISIDMSQEASVEMNDAPSGGATSLVSLWQNNLLGLRAERYINWSRRRSTAVAWINDTNY